MTKPMPPENPAEHLVSAADYRQSFDADLRLRRRAERGDVHRVWRGQYFPHDRWHSLTEDMQYAVRVQAAAAGRRGDVVIPEPVLQHPFVVENSEVFVDFYFPDEDKVGEADGKVKYFDPVMRDGRTPEEVLWDEKRREDGVRRQVHGLTRWGFAIAVSRVRLRTRLLELGLPVRKPGLQTW